MKRVGVDIGGTFTDLLILDEESGDLAVAKVPSTPGNIAEAPMAALEEARRTFGLDPRAVRFVAHGSTVGTNTVIERKGARTGLITTQGFRDVLELGRVARPAELLYDVYQSRPEVLVPRYLRREVRERVNFRGEVLIALDEREVGPVIDDLVSQGVEAVAVALLFSYTYPAHEERILELLRKTHPGVYATVSSALSPLYGEYERTSTAVVNAYIGPVVAAYLEALEAYVERKWGTRLYVMQSNGGIVTSGGARDEPVRVLESGPTAGVIAATYVGGLVGIPNLISFDMGGTTAKAGLIREGRAIETREYEVGGLVAAPGGGHVHGRGTGFPISLPAVEVTEVGAGGGSIAWIDPTGGFRVGPKSMGARPGPACYGLGGEEPTVTDAKVTLGVVNPVNFLGGRMRLEPELAARAIEEKICGRLGLSRRDAARGIIRIANAQMAQAIRLVSIDKGHDPREFVLMAFGGAGPMHACEIAQDLEIPWVVVPRFPGAHSALGLIVTDIVHDFLEAYSARELLPETMTGIYEGLEARARRALEQDRVHPEARLLVRTADIRYRGQTYTINVPVAGGRLGAEEVSQLVEAFHAKHDALYGFRSGAELVEVVNLRLKAVGTVARPPVRPAAGGGRSAEGAVAGRRSVFFEGLQDFVACPVFDRSGLRPGNVIKGPAVVEQVDSTIEIPPDMVGAVDAYLNLFIGRDEWRGQLGD